MSAAYRKRWKLDRELGIERSYVEVAVVAKHMATLLDQGVSATAIAKVAGVAPTTANRIARAARGLPDAGGPMVQRAVARRLLAVTLDDVLHRSDLDGLVPAFAARRRVQALQAIGWTHLEISTRMDCGQNSQTVLSQPGELVERRTALAIERVYRHLSTRPGPSDITRARAVRRGYVSPLAWNDIDDPNEVPGIGVEQADAGYIDEIAVARVVAGDSLPLTTAERLVAVRLLAARGVSDIEIAERTQVDPRTVGRDRWSNGIRPGYQPTQTHRPANLRRTA